MIQVILLILKMIGITLLAILGLVLFILALVLFVPVFYKAEIIHNPQKTQVKAGASFLFPLLSVRLEYMGKMRYAVRIFGISLFSSEKSPKENRKKSKSKKEKQKKNKSGKRPERKKKKAAKPEKKEKTKKVIKPGEKAKKDTGKQPERSEKPNKLKTKDKSQSRPESKSTAETKENFQKTETKEKSKSGFFEKIKSKIKKIRNTIGSIRQKLGRLLRQKEELVHFLKKPETKRAIAVVWQNLKHLLKHILPRKIKGYVAYGADNPATTGQVIGLISALYAKTGKLLELRPNFEEKQLETDVAFQGRIQLFTLLLIAGKVFFNKELRQAVKDVKKIKETE